MSARKTIASVDFNGKNVDTTLKGLVKSISYIDSAKGEGDTLDLELVNMDKKWLNAWYPVLGDKVKAKLTFKDWEKEGKDKKLNCGSFTLDDISFSGSPWSAKFSAISSPAGESFKTQERTKTWEKISLQAIAGEIAGRYGMSLDYNGKTIMIDKLEQSNNDSSFLSELCDKYGLSMKIYINKLVIFDQGKMEAKGPVATLNPDSFEGGSWDLKDTLYGVYTGATIQYKASDDSKEIKLTVGTPERLLNINETADNQADAKMKAEAQVNKSNEGATTLSGDIFPNPKIVAGVTVTVKGFGKCSGKYYVDKVTWDVSGSGTSQKIEMHRCAKRLPVEEEKKKESKDYQVGDVVNFNGGTHYVSSYPGAKGYNAKPGPAKITQMNGSGKAHPWHLIHTDGSSNVYGWVDDGTFS